MLLAAHFFCFVLFFLIGAPHTALLCCRSQNAGVTTATLPICPWQRSDCTGSGGRTMLSGISSWACSTTICRLSTSSARACPSVNSVYARQPPTSCSKWKHLVARAPSLAAARPTALLLSSQRPANQKDARRQACHLRQSVPPRRLHRRRPRRRRRLRDSSLSPKKLFAAQFS